MIISNSAFLNSDKAFRIHLQKNLPTLDKLNDME